MQGNNLQITISANTADLRANLAVAQSAMRDYTRELSSAARTARSAGDELAMSKLSGAAAQYERQATAVAGLKTQMEAAARSSATTATGWHSAGNAAQQLSFQVNDLFTQIAAGTSVQQALLQQGGQIAQVFQTNTTAAAALATAIGVLSSPIGIAVAAVAALTAGLLLMRSAANEAQQALKGVYNEALAGGRDPAAAEKQFKDLRDIVTRGRNLNLTDAGPIATAITAIPQASEQAKRSIAQIADVWRQVQFEGDAEKTAEAIRKMFGSAQSLENLVSGNKLLTGQPLQDFLGAISRNEMGKAIDLAARGMSERFGPEAIRQIETSRTQTFSFVPGLGLMPQGRLPIDDPSRPGYRPLPAPLRLPSDAEIEANKLVSEGNKLRDQHAAKLEEIRKIQEAIARGEIADNERAKNALKTLQQEADELQKKIDKPAEKPKSIMSQLELEFARKQAAIVERSATSGPMSSARALQLIAQHESRNRPLIGWGETDLSGFPLGRTGFPAWPGKMGPSGLSTAAGLYQITRSTWDPIASRLGIRDFSAGSQGQVAEELYRTRGFQPWAPHNPALRSAIAAEGGAGAGEAARGEALRNAVEFWTKVRDESKVTGDDLVTVERKIADARRQLAEDTMREGERSAKDAAEAARKQAREQEQARREALREYFDAIREEERLARERASKIKEQAAAIKAAFDQWAAPFRSAFASVESSISSGVSGLVLGQRTWKETLADVGRSVTQSTVDLATNIASRVAAGPLARVLGEPTPKSGEGASDVLGNAAASWVGRQLSGLVPSLGDVFGKTGAEVAGATAAAPILSAGIVAGATAAAPILTAAMSTGGLAGAGGAAAGVAGIGAAGAGVAGAGAAGAGAAAAGLSLAAIAPWALGGLAVGALVASLFSKGGIVPRAARGMIVPGGLPTSLPSNFGTDRVLSALTPNEMVLPVGEKPSNIANRLSAQIDAMGGGTTVHNHFSFGSPMASPGEIMRMINRATRLGGGGLRPV